MRRIGWLLLLLLTARQTAYAQFAQPTADETLPPVGQAARPFAAPTPYSVTLPNGLRVLVVEKPGSGVVCVQMTVRAGSDKDGERPGLALMTAKLLALGTEKRSPDQIARRIEALGGTMRCRVDRDAAHIQISSLAANTENAVELLSDMVRQPTFLAAEIERRRLQMRDDLTLAIADPSALSQIAIGRLLFGSASYGSPTQGTPEGIAKIMKDDLIRFHLAAYRPDRATLIVAGDVAPGEVFNFAKRYWADWKSNGRVPALPESEAPTPTLPRRFLILDTPDAAKAAILVARNIPRPDEPDFSRGMTALSALNRFGGRLAGEFGGSTIIARRGSYLALSATAPDAAVAETVQRLLSRMDSLSEDAPKAAELASAKAAALFAKTAQLETAESLAALYGDMEAMRLPPTQLNTHIRAMQSVGEAEIRDTALKRFSSDAASILIVGDMPKLLPELKKRFPGADIQSVPLERLDLNRASLFRETDTGR